MQAIYLKATSTNKGTDPGSGLEYGALVLEDESGQVYWTSGFNSGSATQVDFAFGSFSYPPGFFPIAYVHVHPELYPDDDAEKDGFTNNHFSAADENVAYNFQIDAFVAVGGTTDFFGWTPPASSNPAQNPLTDAQLKQSDTAGQSINSGPTCQ